MAMLLHTGEEATADWLQTQLSAAQQDLEETESSKTLLSKNKTGAAAGRPNVGRSSNDENSNENNHQGRQGKEGAKDLLADIEGLELAKSLAEWASTHPADNDALPADVQRCYALGELLIDTATRADCRDTKLTVRRVLDKEYLPLVTYVRGKLLLKLRQSLRRVGFPSKKSVEVLRQQCDVFRHIPVSPAQSIVDFCHWMTKLQVQQETLTAGSTSRPNEDQHQEGRHDGPSMNLTANDTNKLDVVVELCRPLVENVSFHFLQQSDDRITSTKTDRLPEWVIGYIRENVFESGLWEVLSEDLAPKCAAERQILEQFLGEVQKVVEYVLVERGFFRHGVIAGERSSPHLLLGAIEQLLRFDELIEDSFPHKLGTEQDSERHTGGGLCQRLVANDESLFAWWMDRERSFCIASLFDSALDTPVESHRVSPRAEIFCALIQANRAKAGLLQPSSGKQFIAKVLVPLCQEFIDAVHESAKDLRALLGQRKPIVPEGLDTNLELWICLVNGVAMAAQQLVRPNERPGRPVASSSITTPSTTTTTTDSDLDRVGRSLERLCDALIDEVSSTLVETVLMERAKLAAYIMRCSYTLSNQDGMVDHTNDRVEEKTHVGGSASNDDSHATDDDNHSGMSADLQETAALFQRALLACDRQPDFGSSGIKANITERLAEKFIEVALDAHAMTPEIVLRGAKRFALDVRELFGADGMDAVNYTLLTRLLEIVSFMSMEAKAFADIRNVLEDLVGATRPEDGSMSQFHIEDFVHDGTIAEQAGSMIAAKGFVVLSLEEALSILNRRQH